MHDKLKTNAAARKVYETDLQKVDRWCKDTDMKCAIEPALDCATEVLQEQYKQYKVKYQELFDELGSTKQLMCGIPIPFQNSLPS